MSSPISQAISITGVEQRSSVRKYIPCKIIARGKDKRGKLIEAEGSLHNLSETGLYMRIPYCVDPGTRMDFFIGFYSESSGDSVGVHLHTTGMILRVESQPNDSCDAAAEFEAPLPLS